MNLFFLCNLEDHVYAEQFNISLVSPLDYSVCTVYICVYVCVCVCVCVKQSVEDFVHIK